MTKTWWQAVWLVGVGVAIGNLLTKLFWLGVVWAAIKFGLIYLFV